VCVCVCVCVCLCVNETAIRTVRGLQRGCREKSGEGREERAGRKGGGIGRGEGLCWYQHACGFRAGSFECAASSHPPPCL